jgi:DNA mismatch repair protein MutS
VAPFTSILSPHADAMVGAGTAPDCFPDLHLDEIVAAVVAGNTDDAVDDFFYAPARDLATIDYRQQVFRDLDHDNMRRAIQAFVDGMRTMRRCLDRAEQVWHPLQRQGWFVEAVTIYCDAVTQLHEDLVSRAVNSFQ